MDKILPSGQILRKYRIKRSKKYGHILQHQLCFVWITIQRNIEETEWFDCGEVESLVFRFPLDKPVETWKNLQIILERDVE